MLTVSIGGSREGKTGGITGKEQASLFGIPASAYAINACNLSLHAFDSAGWRLNMAAATVASSVCFVNIRGSRW